MIGGKGKAEHTLPAGDSTRPSLSNYANNDGWWDDVSDGPITATIQIRRSGTLPKTFVAEGAWVLVGPPDFAPGIRNIVSLWDLFVDLAAREIPTPSNDARFHGGSLGWIGELRQEFPLKLKRGLLSFNPNFGRDILPLLRAMLNLDYVSKPARLGHARFNLSNAKLMSMAKTLRVTLFNRVRPPVAWNGPSPPASARPTMPSLLGDQGPRPGSTHQFLTVTHLQYAMLERWKNGHFVRSLPGASASTPLSPEALDQAAAENCVGGAFCPGIEVGWQIRHAKLYSAPFRINHLATSTYHGESNVIQPGHFSRQMAQPWHADFRDCQRGNGPVGWWPAQRPDDVLVSGARPTPLRWTRHSGTGTWKTSSKVQLSMDEMRDHWSKFGFVLDTGAGSFRETGRNSAVP